MVGKRTYSTREKQRTAFKSDASPDSNKRQKHNDSDELDCLTPKSDRSGKAYSALKRVSRRFSGPVSIPDEQMDVEKCPHANGKPIGLFDKAINGRLHSSKTKQADIHGNIDVFNATMNDKKNSIESTARPKASYLPTPPAEAQKTSGNGTNSRPSSSNGYAVKPASKNIVANGSIETSKLFDKIIKNEKTEQPYTPREYASAKTPAPRKNIIGDRLSKKGKEARL